MAAKHEVKNLIISFAAIVLAVFSLQIIVASGFTHQLGKFTDQILIQLGLMPEHIVC